MARHLSRFQYPRILKHEQHSSQFALKRDALLRTRLDTLQTGRKHQVVWAITCRDLMPRTCWAVVLEMQWQVGGDHAAYIGKD